MIQVCNLSFANNSITDTLGNYSLVSSGTVTISSHTYPANTDPILYGTDSSYNYVEFGQTATYSNGAIIQAGVPTYGSENWSVEFRARAPSVLPVLNTGLYVLFFGCSAPYDDNGTIRTGGYWAISIDSYPDATNELRFSYDYNNEDFTLKDNLDLTSWHLYRVTKTAEDILTLHIDGVLVATIDIEQQTGFKSRATLGSFALLGAVEEFPTANHLQTTRLVRLADVKVYADPMGHAEKAISLDNLSRVFRNYNTWLGSQLSGVVGDGTLTIQKNGTNVATFTANQSTAATANITVPTVVSELANDSGYLTSSSNLDASKLTSGTVDIARLPQGALERLVKVANEAARYALTTADVQLGDTVQQLDTGIMYIVTDADHLDNAAGYTEYTAGTAASVPWSGVTGKPTFAAVATSGAYSDLTGTPALAAVATSGAYSDLTGTPTIPTVNNATLTIQKNGTTVKTFTANASSNVTANITVPTKVSELTNDSGYITGVAWGSVTGKPSFATVATSGSYNDLSNKPTIPTTLESLSTNSIPFHNAYPRCKYLGTTITDAQNTAIKNRTYDDLFIGDYWTINGVNWRIVAIDYYYNVGDTNFDKGNIIVMPDAVLYNAQMNTTNTTSGAYAGSLMRTQNISNARTIAQNAFGSHLANHRIILASSVDSSGPNSWTWYDSDGVELPNEVQIYGTRVWGSALKGYDVATQKQQFPLMMLAPQFVNTRQSYWLQDVSSSSVSGYFAYVGNYGGAYNSYASNSFGVRPSVTLSFI